MICSTVKAGSECAFMTKVGCGYNGGSCHEIVAMCEGCQKVMEVSESKYCSSYPNPVMKWKMGNCNFATHIKAAQSQQAKVNPLKASKRATKKK